MRKVVVVCPVVPEPPVTGGRKRTLRLLEAIESAGGRPHLLTADDTAPAGVAAIRDRGWDIDVRVHPRPGPAARASQHLCRRPSPFLSGVAARLRELVAAGVAFVQFEHTQSAYYDACGVPAVLSLQNLDSERLRRTAAMRRPGTAAWLRAHHLARATAHVERRRFPRMASVLCVSDDDARRARAFGATTVVAPNGVDDGLFEIPIGSAGPAGRQALFFGDLGYEPNVRGLERFVVEGWPATVAAVPDARLAVVGAGVDHALRRRLLRHHHVDVAGLVDDLRVPLAASSAVVVPIWEGGGTRLKVLEAMAAGRPLVSTPFGVDGSGVRDGQEAVLAGDPAVLGRRLATVLVHRDRSAALAAAGRALAEQVRWSRTLAPAVAAYRSWLAA
jgi:glycosyltransferase involved in cell wall biosynthesis